MSARERCRLLHNMSAPPRSQLTFRPVAPPADPGHPDAPGGNGMRWLCRLTLSEREARLHEDFGPVRSAEIQSRNDGLARMALAIALAEEAGAPTPSEEVWSRVWDLPPESVADETREVARRVDLAALGFPRFALALRDRTTPRPAEPSMRIAVAIHARMRGMTFLRDAEPLARAYLNTTTWDLWLPLRPARPEEGR